MGVHIQRGLEIRVAEKSLRGLERLAVCVQERCVRVTERVPRDPWLFDPIARWREFSVVQVFIVERSPLLRKAAPARGKPNSRTNTIPSSRTNLRIQGQKRQLMKSREKANLF